MRFNPRSTRTTLAALTLAIAASACAGNDDATTDNVAGGTVDTANAAATANTNTSFRVSDVELGKRVDAENKLAESTDDFGVRDTIVAVVKTEGASSGTTLMARWMYQDGQVVEEQSQTINATGDMTTVFRLSKATAWPKGTYKLAIMLNGAEVETEDFEIK